MASCVAVIASEDAVISGIVRLKQEKYEDPTLISCEGEHGVAIHVCGDLSNIPESLGLHYNPYKKTHGAPDSDERHVGSLGNILVGEDGTGKLVLEDKLVALIGPYSVIGRSFVIYSQKDDFGETDHEMSLINGNSGEPIAFGVIGVSF